MKSRMTICVAIVSALLVGLGAETARRVRAEPGAQAATSDDALGVGISLRSAQPYILKEDSERDHAVWVSQALKRMRTIRAGMKRRDLETIFERAGGIYGTATPPVSGHLWGVYGYRDCPNFKVEVEFDPVRTAKLNNFGYRTTPEDPNDVIVKISRPFVDDVVSD